MTFKIEADFPLESDWLPTAVFTRHWDSESAAIATALEGVDDSEEDEVRVVCVETGEAVWRSTEAKHE